MSITVGHSSRWQTVTTLSGLDRISYWVIAITIKNGVSKLTDVYKTNVQTPIFEHLFSYLEEENYKKVYDQIESISYTEFVGPNNFPMERSERVHKLKFDDWNP